MAGNIRYEPGIWSLIVRDGGSVMLPGTSSEILVRDIWEQLRSGSISEILSMLTGEDPEVLAAVPAFAVVMRDGVQMRVIVHGVLSARFRVDGDEVTITGGDSGIVPDGATLVLSSPEAKPGTAVLPLVAGVVRANAVSLIPRSSANAVVPGGRRARREHGAPETDCVPSEAQAVDLTDDQIDAQFAEIAEIADRELQSPEAPAAGDHDGNTKDVPVTPAVDPPPSLADLSEEFPGTAVLSSGQVLPLERAIVLGRRPRPSRSTRDTAPLLVTVDSPSHDVSRNHIEIHREGDDVLVTDLDTTNGTLLIRGAEQPRRLQPGDATLVIDGDIIDLGDSVTITFQDLP